MLPVVNIEDWDATVDCQKGQVRLIEVSRSRENSSSMRVNQSGILLSVSKVGWGVDQHTYLKIL